MKNATYLWRPGDEALMAQRNGFFCALTKNWLFGSFTRVDKKAG
ncbi:hypothetical protein [Fibrisoma montanum]|nr:hypothetical protein [Fibrisoma montanum]